MIEAVQYLYRKGGRLCRIAFREGILSGCRTITYNFYYSTSLED